VDLEEEATKEIEASMGRAASVAELAPLQRQFLAQRELFMQVLRKMTTMQDDLTRKDVIIHNLRQEVQTQRQEVETLNQNFEQQQAQASQQHQMAQLTQLQQLQELQRLLQQQQQMEQLQRQAPEHALQQQCELEPEQVLKVEALPQEQPWEELQSASTLQ